VDEFFNDGIIWLPSFKKLREHSDESRRDIAEGRVKMEIEVPNAHHAVIATNAQDAYVLCAVTVESGNAKNHFKADSGFRIKDTLAFADCISRQIPGLVGGIQGFCSYRKNTLLQKKLDVPFKPPESYKNPEEFASEYESFIGAQSIDAFFIKASEYSYQCEYRFIWFVQGVEKEDYKKLCCPEATKFCERID
jgi:hypothetical protein